MLIKGATALTIKDADKGEVEAVVATLNVIDKDGDVILPGFIGTQNVAILRSHQWATWPVGKGVITDEDGKEAKFSGRINLDVEEGRTAFDVLKFQAELQEWSWGFSPKKGSVVPGEHDGHDVTYLGPLPDGSVGSDVYEVSPVLVGAGENTRTTALKGIQPGGSGPLDEQVDSVLAAVKDLLDRYGPLADLRAEKDRRLSADHIETIEKMLADLEALHGKATAPDADDVEVERLRYEALRSERIFAGLTS